MGYKLCQMTLFIGPSPALVSLQKRAYYCNSLLYGSPDYVIKRLQRVQNNLARVVMQSPPRAHAPLLLSTLHWLPVSRRISYKIALLTFKARKTSIPSYLSELLAPANSTGYGLRSSTRTPVICSTNKNCNCVSRFFLCRSLDLEQTTGFYYYKQ